MTTKLGALSAVVAILAGWPAAASGPPMPVALKGVEAGEWELRDRGEGELGAPRKICVADPRALLQVRHPRRSCRTFVVSDALARVIVTYDCGPAGNGRTDLRVETSRLVQIHSQGVAEGAPYSFALEGRRVGACH